jgi:two-component sensor histidine kinase
MDAMSSGDQFVLETHFERGCVLASDRGLNLGLFIAELITNAIKHAHPSGAKGRIRAGGAPDQDGIVAWVSDDGVGFPQGFDLARDSGVGLRTLRVIAQQTDVELDFSSSELGLNVQLRIPHVAKIIDVQFA